jgi:hypothetical protein
MSAESIRKNGQEVKLYVKSNKLIKLNPTTETCEGYIR